MQLKWPDDDMKTIAGKQLKTNPYTTQQIKAVHFIIVPAFVFIVEYIVYIHPCTKHLIYPELHTGT